MKFLKYLQKKVFAEKMDTTEDYYVKQNKPDLARQILYVFLHMWLLDFNLYMDIYMWCWYGCRYMYSHETRKGTM